MTIGHGHYRGKMLYAYYGHFEKLFVSINDRVKRGQVLGLAAALPARFKKKIRDMEPHLHFELFQPKEGFGITGNLQLVLKTGDPTIWRTVYNPDDFWLGGESECFDANKDYSKHTNLEFTHPVACGEYGRALVNRLKNK